MPSKYFYNEKGDKLFQGIMSSPEYYLTRAEFEIFNSQSEKIAEIFSNHDKPFDLIELGAGDGTKTKVLLQKFVNKQIPFTYMPIDISKHVIQYLEKHVKEDIPNININGIAGDYFEKLHELQMMDDNRKVVLFLGSNIGNFKKGKDVEFLRLISKNLNKGDLLMLGCDLVKDPDIIRNAYNDSLGVTSEFNLNLLDRINDELGANFNRTNFMHYPIYDVAEKQARSYIVSKRDQEVFIKEINRSYHFKAWEYIHTEISQKYSIEDIEHLASNSGFKIIDFLYDCKHYYTDVIWEKE